MWKLIQRNSKLFNIAHNSQTFEVRLQNTSQFSYAKRNHHIWNGRQQYYLCATCNTPQSKNKRISQFSSPFINGSHFASTVATIIPDIPEPPVAPVVQDIVEAAVSLSANGEPTFASMGLGGWSPVGMIQNCMEFLHVTVDLPWWGAIMLGTLCVRTIVFPLVIIAQRNNAVMNNNLPQMQAIQLKMSNARQSGNQLEAARYGQELMIFMKTKGLSPFKNMLVPLAQAPIFISFFLGLRGMANTPVDSLSTGGLFWFTDLIVPDPYYLLPVITSLTLLATIEVGTDSVRMSSQNMGLVKYGLRALPFIMFPFIMNFPGAILCYWVSTNFISLGQVAVLKIPRVREYFKINKLITHDPGNLPIKKKGFINGAKESWTNLRLTKEMEERQKIDEILFNKAGKGPLQKTYKYDPTKVIQAKKVDR